MIRKVETKPFMAFKKAVIGGTYIDEVGNISIVSFIDDGRTNPFILTSLTNNDSMDFNNIDQVTEELGFFNARIIELRLVEMKPEDIRDTDSNDF